MLRSRRGESFEVAARVRAGWDAALQWADTSPPAGRLRYKIRRECLDVRFQHESGEAQWPPNARGGLHLARLHDESPAREIRLELAGIVRGPVTLRMYDLQGRQVHSRMLDGTGDRQAFTIDPARDLPTLPSSMYFLRAVDTSGLASETVKIVLAR